jgi:hypothetical protein
LGGSLAQSRAAGIFKFQRRNRIIPFRPSTPSAAMMAEARGKKKKKWKSHETEIFA